MATKTPNYGLIKPSYDDSADIQVINGNMDVLDTKLKEIANTAGSAGSSAFQNLDVNSVKEWTFTKGDGTTVKQTTINTSNYTNNVNTSVSTADTFTNTSADTYSKLQYFYGTSNYKLSSSTTVDGANLIFNHWKDTPWNCKLQIPNNPSSPPAVYYQYGVTGNQYTQCRVLATENYVDSKASEYLPLSGGTLTGRLTINSGGVQLADGNYIRTASDSGAINIRGGSSNGAILQLFGSGVTSAPNEAWLKCNNTNYKFKPNCAELNGLECYYNTAVDVVAYGNGKIFPSLALNKNVKRLQIQKSSGASWLPFPAVANIGTSGTQVYNDSHEGYIKLDNGLLIQWGCVNATGTSVWNQAQTLPLPYKDTGYVAMSTLAYKSQTGHSVRGDNRAVVCIHSATEIGVWSDTDMVVYWLTIGYGAEV